MDQTASPAADKPLKVAIVGTAPMSRMLAPFHDQSWQIWACSGGNMGVLPRVNIWFEMHSVSVMMATENRASSEPFFNWLRQQSEAGIFDVVMLEAGSANGGKFNTYVPKAVPYPRDEMVGLFGRNWFTSSVAYMIALAIARGATEIGLFGVDMAAGQEHYEAQRAGCTRFIEIAEDRGITVTVPYESCLKTAAPMYGYSEATPFGRRLAVTIQQVQAGIAAANAEASRQQGLSNYFGGALEQLQYFQRTWTDGLDLEPDYGNIAEIVQGIEKKLAEQAAVPPTPEGLEVPDFLKARPTHGAPIFVPDSGLERSVPEAAE